MELSYEVAVVTGASQGIGRAIALRLAEEGAAVVCADLKDESGTADEITARGGRASKAVMDVREASDWSRVVSETNASFGPPGILVNAAGVVNTLTPDTVTDLTEEAWTFVLDTDLKGVWLGMRAVIPTMRANGGGRIVNIASMAALKGLPNLAAYSAAKGGVVGLSQQAAIEYAADNVLVSAIAPGTIDTPILADITDEMRTAFAAAHAVNRLGRPEEVAAMVAFLCSEDGAFLTGHTFPVDGGWNTKGS